MEWPSNRADGCQGTRPARLSGDERQPRRKAARWKQRIAVSGFQLVGRISEERDEPGEALIEGSPGGFAEGVEERRGRAGELRRAVQGILCENRLDTDHGSTGLLPSTICVLLHGIHQSSDTRPVVIRRE